jgi:RNA-binding protein
MDKELKAQASQLKPMFQLGKNGMTQQFLDAVDSYLDAHHIVKIKVFIVDDREGLSYYANEVAKELDAEVIDMKGFTFVISRE